MSTGKSQRKRGKGKGKGRGRSTRGGGKRGGMERINARLSGGFPDSMRVTLRYQEIVTLTSTTGATTYYDYRGNGPYDPNQTGTGSQPYNWDDWSVEYARYRCYSSKISIKTASAGTTPITSNARLCIGPRHVSTNPSDFDSMACAPYARWSIVGPSQMPSAATDRLSQRMTTSRILGITATQMEADDDLAALTNTIPAHQWFWTFGMQALDGASTVVHYVTVTLDYDILFWDRIEGTIDDKYKRALENRAGFTNTNSERKERKSVEHFVFEPPLA